MPCHLSLPASILCVGAFGCALGAESGRENVARERTATRNMKGRDASARPAQIPGTEPHAPPWLGRRESQGKPTREQLVEDARFVCNANCTDDALVAHVDRCLLMGKVTKARIQRRLAGNLTDEERNMLNWLITPEGEAARNLDPQTYDDFDRNVLGFTFRDEEAALRRRMDSGYTVKSEEELQVRIERYWDWSKEVCQGTLGNPNEKKP